MIARNEGVFLRRRNSRPVLAVAAGAAALLGTIALGAGAWSWDDVIRAGMKQPEELGQIRWSRDFAAAEAEAARLGRPLLVLFSEVPGCQTCKLFGGGPLSHPLIVEAAESLFVPVAVYNNAGGADEAILKSFGEPAWNNPVIRVMGASRKDLAPRLADDWSVRGVAGAMALGLKAAEQPVPKWLALLAEEAGVRRTDTAVFAMHCFWEGEAKLGAIEGVVGTRPGFLDGHEVVEATYNPDAVSFKLLLMRAREAGCVSRVYPRDRTQARVTASVAPEAAAPITEEAVRPAPDDALYYLDQSPIRAVPMTPMQAMRTNAALGRGVGDAAEWLSPRQAAFAEVVRAKPDADRPRIAGKPDLAAAWREARAVMEKAGR